MKVDFFPLVGYNAARKNVWGDELDGNGGGNSVPKADGGFKRAFQLFFPLTLRTMTSSIYDVSTGFKRPKDILKSDTRHLETCLRANTGDFTFQEAFDRTGRILNITVSSQSRSDPPPAPELPHLPPRPDLERGAGVRIAPGSVRGKLPRGVDTDGTERYESTSRMAFQDGIMEADLPMQQLSEMFNINHLIISQAVSFKTDPDSVPLERSVWAHPLVGYINSILLFIKNHVRPSRVESISAPRASTFSEGVFCSRRKSSVVTYATSSTCLEGEGSLRCGTHDGIFCAAIIEPNPDNHRSLTSAIFNLVKNPTADEFQDMGYRDFLYICDDKWANPLKTCGAYEGQESTVLTVESLLSRPLPTRHPI
ncbi:hypothetical protein ACHAWF_003881 [Thalassiosira exigua]